MKESAVDVEAIDLHALDGVSVPLNGQVDVGESSGESTADLAAITDKSKEGTKTRKTVTKSEKRLWATASSSENDGHLAKIPRIVGGRKPRAKRKSTSTVRKEEKKRLLDEMQMLQMRLSELERVAIVDLQNERSSLAYKALINGFLREEVQRQHMPLANIQSAVSDYVSGQVRLPFESRIHLGIHHHHRRETLQAIKSKKLRDAMSYIKERTRFLDRTRPFCEESRYETEDGDFAILRSDVTPLEGAVSIQAVYDAMYFNFANLEIQLSERLGNITIREADGNPAVDITQDRLVSTVRNGVQMETNKVMFMELGKDEQGEEYGIMVADFVDRDDLYPFVPEQRIRLDIVGVWVVQAHWRKKKKSEGSIEDRERVVVMTRTSLLKIHHTNIVSSPSRVLHDLHHTMSTWNDIMVQMLRERVCPNMPDV